MIIDVAPVVSALEDAGVAVAAVGLAVLLVCVMVSIWKNLQLVFGWGPASNLVGSSGDWEVTDPATGKTFLMGYNEDGSVWEQELEDSSSGREETVQEWAERMRHEPGFREQYEADRASAQLEERG